MEEQKGHITQIIEVSDRHPVVLFDGVCNLCDGFVQFIIKQDPKGQFRFVALQSEVGKNLLETLSFEMQDMSTVVLIENGEIYSHSDVALRIVK